MAKISSSIGKTLYKVTLQSESGNTLTADEPIELGGKNEGFSPEELLAASLAACTSATLRMYADRKGWNLETVLLDIELVRDAAQNTTNIKRQITVLGNLDIEQKDRLMAIANACPIHKMLSNPIAIQTEWK